MKIIFVTTFSVLSPFYHNRNLYQDALVDEYVREHQWVTRTFWYLWLTIFRSLSVNITKTVETLAAKIHFTKFPDV